MKLISTNEIIESNPILCKIFECCPYHILKSMELVSFKIDTIILTQGQQNNYFYIILNGNVEIFYTSETGKMLSRAIKQSGELLGELELMNQIPSISNVKALTDVKLLKIQRKNFIKWLELDHNFCIHLIQHLCNSFCFFSTITAENSIYNLQTRLCKYLVSTCKQISNSTKNIEVLLDKSKICALFSVTLRALNHSLQILREKNLIKTKRGVIIVVDLEKLLEEINEQYF